MLKRKGVFVKRKKAQEIMHHKFAIIDDETLISGSANWTHSAFNRNNECVYIINKLKENESLYLKKLFRILLLESN